MKAILSYSMCDYIRSYIIWKRGYPQWEVFNRQDRILVSSDWGW